jgi:hypothetical protein
MKGRREGLWITVRLNRGVFEKVPNFKSEFQGLFVNTIANVERMG